MQNPKERKIHPLDSTLQRGWSRRSVWESQGTMAPDTKPPQTLGEAPAHAASGPGTAGHPSHPQGPTRGTAGVIRTPRDGAAPPAHTHHSVQDQQHQLLPQCKMGLGGLCRPSSARPRCKRGPDMHTRTPPLPGEEQRLRLEDAAGSWGAAHPQQRQRGAGCQRDPNLQLPIEG